MWEAFAMGVLAFVFLVLPYFLVGDCSLRWSKGCTPEEIAASWYGKKTGYAERHGMEDPKVE